MPLVPLTEENEDAMENKTFQKLLHKAGIRAPADSQVGLDFYSLVTHFHKISHKQEYLMAGFNIQ